MIQGDESLLEILFVVFTLSRSSRASYSRLALGFECVLAARIVLLTTNRAWIPTAVMPLQWEEAQVAQMQCSALLNVKRQQVPYITISFYSSNDYISMRP